MIEILIVIGILGLLSALQRIVPWVLYRKFRNGQMQKLFDLIAVSAFAALMIENMQGFDLQTILPLIPAALVAYRTKNLGATVLVALLFSLILSYLPIMFTF